LLLNLNFIFIRIDFFDKDLFSMVITLLYEVFISCKNTYLIIATLVTSTLPSPIEKYFVFVFLKHVFIAEGKLK
jgi:hypothetical protein